MPTPSADTAGSCRIARATRWGSARRSSSATNVPALCASTFVGAPTCSITPAGRRPERQDHSCVCRFAAVTTAATVVGNDAVVAAELTSDSVEKCAVDTSAVHAHQAGVSGDTSGPAYSRQAIVVPAFSTVKSMLCPRHQCSSSCTSVRLDGPALPYALLTD